MYLNTRMTVSEQRDFRKNALQDPESLGAHSLGFRSYGSRYGLIDNPFDSYTVEYIEWCEGWLEAHKEKVEKDPLF